MSANSFTFVGAGALGQSLAALLAAEGCDITLLARPQRAQSLVRTGCVRVEGVRPMHVPVVSGSAHRPGAIRIIEHAGLIPARSAVIFTVKGPALAGVSAEVRRDWPSAEPVVAWVAGLQNGVGKDDVLIDTFGRDRVVGAATVLGARMAPDSHEVMVTGLGRTYLGEFDGGVSQRIMDASDSFNRAGLPCESPADISGLLWTKCCNAAGAFAISSLTRLASTVMMTRESLVLAYLAVLREAAGIAAAEGITIGDHPDLPIASYLNTPADEVAASITATVRRVAAKAAPSYSSMAQDVIAGRTTEVEEVFGDLVRRAESSGLDVPLLRFTHRLIAGMQPGQ